MNFVCGLLLGVIIGFFMGYTFAHNVIAAECERLGGFFVGKTIYKCVKVEKVEGDKK